MRIVQVGTIDVGGGAAAVAMNLMRAYQGRGFDTHYFVGRKRSQDPSVSILPDNRDPFYRATGYSTLQTQLRQLAGRHPNRGWGLVSRSLRLLTHPAAAAARWEGAEDFDFPYTRELFDHLAAPPDVLQCHNLHGGYFDLRALAVLSQRVPTVVTLHDMWLLTGHCAHSLACDRWTFGCGHCPDLTLDPAVRRDRTAENWRQKRDVYAKSRLHVITPSRWLLDKVEQSMLAPFMRGAKVIPNGVDLTVFRRADRASARRTLGLPAETPVVLVTTGTPGSMWKDDGTLIDAMHGVAEVGLSKPPLFVAVGRRTAVPTGGRVNARSVPYQTDPRVMAAYFQAADLYMHAARADTFPSAVLEALACGTPVVATATGGIPEQLRPRETGLLVPPGDGAAMAEAVLTLLRDPALCERMGKAAERDAGARFGLEAQADAYLAFYGSLGARGSATAVEVECAARH